MFKNFLFSKTNAFGLEIGNKSIKVLELKRKGKKIKVLGKNREILPTNSIINGEIKNEIAVIQTIKKATKHAKPKTIKSKNVIVALPENKTFIKTIEIPKLEDNEIEKIIIKEIEKHIPLSLSEIYFDWQILKINKNSIKIFLAAAPKQIINSYQNAITKAGLIPLVFELEATAEARALIPQKYIKNNLSFLIIDIGETKTLIIICEGNNIPFTKTLYNISGKIFTETIAKNLNIAQKEAEKLKIKCCSLQMTEQERKTLQALHFILDNLAEEINRILDYYQNYFRNFNNFKEILLCGGGAKTIGIAKYLALKLKKRVKLGNPWINIPLLKNEISLMESLIFAKTIGLAMRGVGI